MATNIASKYDNIPCKVLVHSGSPAVHQLMPKKENIGNVEGITLKRVTLGKRDPNKTNKTILLVGETGTGKSTLINALVNYAMGVKWEDDVWFQIIEDKEKKGQSESQISDVIVYEIFGFEGKTLPYSLTIIDTPGYGDTRGTEEDATVAQRLFHLFRSSDGVHEITAVGLVLKASENRLNDRLTYIFNSVMSLFGNDMKNIVALVTHSDGVTPENVLEALKDANIKCAKDENDGLLHFMFNNRQSTQKTEEDEFALKAAWDLTMDQMGQLTDDLKETSPQNLRTTVEVLDTRTGLAACIQNLQERMEMIEKKQREIKQTQEALEKHEEEMKSNDNFKVEVDEPYKDKVPVSEGRWWALWLNHGGAVTCNVCQKNCHYPCTLAWYPKCCEVIKGGRCTVCTGKCPLSDHVKEKWIYESKTRKVKKTLQDVKEKYEKNKAGSERELSLLETLEKEMEKLQKEKDQLLAESFQNVIKLEQIALNVDSLSTHVHVDFLIEKMKEKGDTEKVQKLEEIKARMEKDKGFKAALWYRNISSKYEHITCKVVIPPGSPAVYQLIPEKENIGNVEGITLKRVTLGVKDPNKTNKTILLVGETGTGKSALINALVNYAMGVEWEDDVWFQIVEDEKKRRSESHTTNVIVYKIFGFEGKTLPYSLTIIDTPGYGDIRGTEEDATINKRLFQLFHSSDGVHEINAVGLVLKATVNRLSDRLRYIFDSVMSLFGNDMENIVALITHFDGVSPENVLQALEDANVKCAKDEEDEPLHFMFNNCQSKQKTKRNKVPLKATWDSTMDQMGKFTDYLKETSPQNLITTVEVLDARTRLKASIQNLQERMEMTELKQTEIKQTQKALKKHEEEMKSNEKFTVEVDEVYKVKVPVPASISERRWWWLWLNYGGATTCNVCQENCHHPCTLAWYKEHCEVIQGGCCTVCTGKCPLSDHVKEELIYETKTRKVKKTLEDVKEKYEENKAGSESKLSLLETLEKEMEKLQKEKDQWLEKSFQHLVKLEQIALNVDSLSTHVHVDFLIEKMKEKGDTEKVQKLKEIKRRMEKDKETKAALRYAYGEIKAARKSSMK